MPYGTGEKQKGQFYPATLAATSKAADTNLPDDMRVSLTETDAPEGYPISGFTWILVYKDQGYETGLKKRQKGWLSYSGG